MIRRGTARVLPILLPVLLGFTLAVAGLVARSRGGIALSTRGSVLLMAGACYLGAGLVAFLLACFWVRQRIVPYFARPLEVKDATEAAFTGGRSLYRRITELDRLADSLGVMRLSSFGFADELEEQELRWHDAGHGLRTVRALHAALAESPSSESVCAELTALATALQAAHDRVVPFSLILRLRGDGGQALMYERSARRGSFE